MASGSSATFLEHMCAFDIDKPVSPFQQSGIVCTIGPASRPPEMLVKMMETGMTIARMNFSHGSHEYHAETIANVRQAVDIYSAKLGRYYPCAIALDTKGPEIRTGVLEAGTNSEVELVKGSNIKLTTDMDNFEKCTGSLLYVDYENITKVLQPGNKVFIDDGLISLVVTNIGGNFVDCQVENGGMLGSKKGVNLPGVPVDLPPVSEKDKSDLLFGVQQGVDMVFASFIRDAAGVKAMRSVLGPEGKNIMIISKIENHQGVHNLDAIIEESEGIMVARGDLGIEIPAQKVFVAQKAMIARCNRSGKPIICATQMLESMVKKPRPTRAEASDVANAILDGADSVMLSGETAKGDYPLECIQTMSDCCKEAESNLWTRRIFLDLIQSNPPPLSVTEATAISSVEAATKVVASAIVTVTSTGLSAQLISKYRPRCPIIAVTRNPQVARQMFLWRAIKPIFCQTPVDGDWQRDVDARVKLAIDIGLTTGWIKKGTKVVTVTGERKGPGSTNTVRVITVA